MNTAVTLAISDLAEINPGVNAVGLGGESLVSFIPMSDVSDTGQWTGRQQRRLDEVRVGYTPFAEGDVLFAKITPCMENGKGAHATGLSNGIGFGSTEFHVLRARGDNDPRFLFHWLQARTMRTRAVAFMGGSAGQQRVRAEFFTQFRVPRIESREQRRIAAVLDTVDEALVTTEAVIAKLQRLEAGLRHDLLTCGLDELEQLRDPIARPEQFQDSPLGRVPREWNLRTIEELAVQVTDGEHQTPARSPDGIYLLSARNVLSGDLSLDDVDFISEEEYQRISQRCRPEAGDVLISCSGTIGRVCEVPEDFRCALVRSVAIIKLRKDVASPRFVVLVGNSPAIQKQIAAGQRQLAQANLFQSEIRRLRFPVPAIGEQEAIVARANSIEQSLRSEQDVLEKLTMLKRGLADDLLTGRVQAPEFLATKVAP